MVNRVGQYQITETDIADPEMIDEAINELKRLGKKKIYPYGAGQICFHHRNCYFFISPHTMKWTPRHKAHCKWYAGCNSIEEIFSSINGWCDYRDRKRQESSI
jgi:hypothetical protein